LKSVLPITFLLCSLLSAAQAVEFKQTDSFLVNSNEVQEAELWISTFQLETYGELKDNLFFAANKAELNGIAHKDVWGISLKGVQVGGDCKEDVRLLTQDTIKFKGSIAGNTIAIANAIQLNKQASIQGDAIFVGENIVSKGAVGGDLSCYGMSVNVGGKISGNLHISSSNITLMPGIEIMGDLTYTSTKDLRLGDQVILHGKLTKSLTPVKKTDFFQAQLKRFSTQLYFLLAASLVAIPLLGFFPLFCGMSVTAIQRYRSRCFFVGLICFFALPLISVMLIFSIIGTPLGLVTMGIFLIALYAGKIMVALTLGTHLLHVKQFNSFWQLLSTTTVGLIVLYLLFSLPIIGITLWLFVSFTGLGGVLGYLFQTQRQWLYPSQRGSSSKETSLQDESTISKTTTTTDENKQE